MDNSVRNFLVTIDNISQINFLYNPHKENIIANIKKNILSLLVLEIVWDNWYTDQELSCLPMSIRQWYRFADNRPWKYYVCDFGTYKKFSIGAFGGSWPRENDAEFQDIVSDPCMHGRVIKTSMQLKDILDYFSSDASRQKTKICS